MKKSLFKSVYCTKKMLAFAVISSILVLILSRFINIFPYNFYFFEIMVAYMMLSFTFIKINILKNGVIKLWKNKK